MRGTGRDGFDVRKFLRLSESVERTLIRAILLLFAALLIFQCLLTIGAVRERLTGIDRAEGRAYSFAPFVEPVVYYTSAKAGHACFSLRDEDVCCVLSHGYERKYSG